MTSPTQDTGRVAETRVMHYLEEHGLECITRNFRIRRGEIDLIMRDRDEVVFVEVRARADSHFGDGIESITRAKQRRLVAAAAAWLQRQRHEPATRFDVAGVDDSGRVTWLKDAFRADD